LKNSYKFLEIKPEFIVFGKQKTTFEISQMAKIVWFSSWKVSSDWFCSLRLKLDIRMKMDLALLAQDSS
jgi:hypothetical protein